MLNINKKKKHQCYRGDYKDKTLAAMRSGEACTVTCGFDFVYFSKTKNSTNVFADGHNTEIYPFFIYFTTESSNGSILNNLLKASGRHDGMSHPTSKFYGETLLWV
jgi:hypothetical protein